MASNQPSFQPSDKQRRRKRAVSFALALLALGTAAVATRYPAQAPIANAASQTVVGQICKSQADRDGWPATVEYHPQCAPYAVDADARD